LNKKCIQIQQKKENKRNRNKYRNLCLEIKKNKYICKQIETFITKRDVFNIVIYMIIVDEL